MINEAIILAGGMGTRLKGVINNIPKPMAPIGDHPFLEYLMTDLVNQGVERIILSVGYQYQIIQEYFGNKFLCAEITYAIEETPLGTGGGISLALSKTNNDHIFIINGDTFFQVDLTEMGIIHRQNNSEITLALKHLQNFDRYGTVKLNETQILSFEEKQPVKDGWINGGIYALNKLSFLNKNFPNKYSFEKDYLESYVSSNDMKAFCSNGYFIDIGIPEDYQRGQTEIPKLIQL